MLLICVVLQWTLTQSVDGIEPTKTVNVDFYKLEKFDAAKKTFDEAGKECYARDSWLVEIKTKEIDHALTGLIEESNVWIGLSCSNKQWKWGDGSLPSYTNWTGRPKSSTGKKCAEKKSSGQWIVSNCGEKKAYVCQSDAEYPEGYLSVHNSEKSYNEAVQACENNNQTLVDVKRQELHSLILQKYRFKSTGKPYWTSGNDLNTKNVWLWGDGTSINISSTNWLQWSVNPEPNGKDEHCVAFVAQSPMREGWADAHCSMQINFICQDKCGTGACFNNATCAVLNGRYKCHCATGYFGNKCEKKRKFVSNGNCQFLVYYDESFSFTHESAKNICIDLGGTLAMMKSAAIQDFVESVLIDQYGEDGDLIALWIGGHKPQQTWIWMDGTKIAITSGFQRWYDNYNRNEEVKMLMTSWRSTRDNLRWRGLSASQERSAFVCEKSEMINPCESSSCANGGTCVAIGCQTNCDCPSGYGGDKCEIELILLATKISTYFVTTGENVTVTLNVTSHVGPIKIDVYRDPIEGIVETKRNVTHGPINITIGPLTHLARTETLQFRGTPESNVGSFYNYSNVTLEDGFQKWTRVDGDRMIFSVDSTNIMWSSHPKTVSSDGFVCEKADDSDPCKSLRCLNGGRCIKSGCQSNCLCAPGYGGIDCRIGTQQDSANDGMIGGIAAGTFIAICLIIFAQALLIRRRNSQRSSLNGAGEKTQEEPYYIAYFKNESQGVNQDDQYGPSNPQIQDRGRENPYENELMKIGHA